MAIHSSALAWRIPGMGEPGGLPSMGLHSRTRLKRLSSSSSNKEYRFKMDYTLRKILAFIAGSSGVMMNLGGGFVQWFWLGSTSLVVQLVKNPPAMWETWVQSLGWGDPLEKGKTAHSSILAWRSPWTIQSMESQRIGHD